MARPCVTLPVLAGLLVSVALTVTSCAQPRPCPTGPVAAGLAIAVGGRADSARPSWPGRLDSQLTRIIAITERETHRKQPVTAGATFIRVDGAPSVGCVMSYDASAGNGPARDSNRQAFMGGVQQEVSRLQAGRPQAARLGAGGAPSAAAGPGGTVVLIDSGLQTVPPLDFARADLLDADIDSVVTQLRAQGELPRLHGQTVILAGLGYTAPPQAPLDESQRDHLIELWRQIATAGGAAQVQVIATPDTSPAGRGLPAVTAVPVPPPDDVTLGCGKQSDLADSGAVGFVPNSTTFRDAAAARVVLARIAGWLHANPAADASLTGSIAHYGADDPGGLSQARAERIRDVLLTLGATAGQVTAAGAGWGPFPAPAAPPDPVSDPLNRRVVVRLMCP